MLGSLLKQFMTSDATLRGEWLAPWLAEAVPVQIIIAGGAVQLASWVASPFWKYMPPKLRRTFPKHDSAIPARASLSWLRDRPKCKHMYAGFSKLLAYHLEQQCMSQELPSDALAACSDKWYCRKDPEVRRQHQSAAMTKHARGSSLNQFGKMAQPVAAKFHAYTYQEAHDAPLLYGLQEGLFWSSTCGCCL